MRDLAVIQRFLPGTSRGGVGHFTHGLCQTLARRGHRVTVFSQDPAPADALYTVRAVPLRREWRSRWAPLAFPFAVAHADFGGFDLVHAQGDEQWLPRRRPPVVRTLHGTALAEAWFNGLRAGSIKRAAMHAAFYAMELIADVRADRVVAVSRHTARFYPRVHRVIPNGVDVAAFAGPVAKSPQPSVVFIGELDTRKRGRLLVDVMRRVVRPALPQAELWLVGPGGAEAAAQDGAGVQGWSQMGDAALRELIGRAWVLCLPSAYEGFGRPYIEAMAAGTAVVASPNPGAREVLEEGRDGIIASDAELGRALLTVLTDAAERARLVARGRERAAAFDWAVVADAYEEVYDEAAAGRAGRRAIA